MKRKNPKIFKKGRNGKIGRFNGKKDVVNNFPSREDDSGELLCVLVTIFLLLVNFL